MSVLIRVLLLLQAELPECRVPPKLLEAFTPYEAQEFRHLPNGRQEWTAKIEAAVKRRDAGGVAFLLRAVEAPSRAARVRAGFALRQLYNELSDPRIEATELVGDLAEFIHQDGPFRAAAMVLLHSSSEWEDRLAAGQGFARISGLPVPQNELCGTVGGDAALARSILASLQVNDPALLTQLANDPDVQVAEAAKAVLKG